MYEMLVQLWSVKATRTTHLCRKMLTEDEDRDGARMPGAGQTCGRGWKAAGGAGLSTPCTGNNSSISQQPPAPVPALLQPAPAGKRKYIQLLSSSLQHNFDIDILMNTDTIFILLDLCYIETNCLHIEVGLSTTSQCSINGKIVRLKTRQRWRGICCSRNSQDSNKIFCCSRGSRKLLHCLFFCRTGPCVCSFAEDFFTHSKIPKSSIQVQRTNSVL